MYRCPIKDPTCITWRFPRQNEPTYHTNCPTECRSNEFETCGADKASADGLLRASGVGIDPHGIIKPKPKHIQPIALKQHGIRMLLWHLVLVVVSTLVINCMYSTIGYSIKTLIHDVVALQKGVKRMNYNQDGISLLMWDFTLLFTVLVLIDWMKQTLNKGVTIKEFDGIQRAECKLSGSTDQPQNEMEPCRAHVDWINERSGPRNHIIGGRKDPANNNVQQKTMSMYEASLNRVPILLIFHASFTAVQGEDYQNSGIKPYVGRYGANTECDIHIEQIESSHTREPKPNHYLKSHRLSLDITFTKLYHQSNPVNTASRPHLVELAMKGKGNAFQTAVGSEMVNNDSQKDQPSNMKVSKWNRNERMHRSSSLNLNVLQDESRLYSCDDEMKTIRILILMYPK
eukprot:493494_1